MNKAQSDECQEHLVHLVVVRLVRVILRADTCPRILDVFTASFTSMSPHALLQ